MSITSQEDSSTAAQCWWSDRIVAVEGSKGLWEMRDIAQWEMKVQWMFSFAWGRKKKKKVSSKLKCWCSALVRVCSYGCTFYVFISVLTNDASRIIQWSESITYWYILNNLDLDWDDREEAEITIIRWSGKFHCLISESQMIMWKVT